MDSGSGGAYGGEGGDEDGDCDNGTGTGPTPAATRHSDNGPLQRYKLVVAYDGTRFKGFQRQTSSSYSSSRQPSSSPSSSTAASSLMGSSEQDPTPPPQPPTQPALPPPNKNTRCSFCYLSDITVPDISIYPCIGPGREYHWAIQARCTRCQMDLFFCRSCPLKFFINDINQLTNHHKQRHHISKKAAAHAASLKVVDSPNPRHFKRRRLDPSTGRPEPANLTVQECLEDALELYTGLDRNKLRLRFAGRTDAGVHARGQVVAVSLPNASGGTGSEATTPDDDDGAAPWRIRRAINSRLPVDITVEDVAALGPGLAETFDPRSDATRKRYSYTMRYRRKAAPRTAAGVLSHPICAGGGPHLLRTALDPPSCWICPWPLDDSCLDEYCAMLSGTHDYAAFVHREARPDRDNNMTVERLDCQRLSTATKDGVDGAPICEVRFVVEARGFGRAQVRNLVGFVVDLCRGAIPDEGGGIADRIWEDPERLAKLVHAAPACGLCLDHVSYDTIGIGTAMGENTDVT